MVPQKHSSRILIIFLVEVALVITALAAVMTGQTLVGYWKFDDGSGTTAADSSGNGHTATLVNRVSWVAGQIGDAVSANAANSQYLGIPTIDLSTTKVVTVAFWTKRTYSTSGGHTLVEASANFNNSTTGFGFFPDDAACQGIQASVNGDVGYTAMCYHQPTSGVWHHIAVIYDKSKAGASEVMLYIDGVLQVPTGQLFTATNTNYFGNNPIYLFARGGTKEFNSGVVDDLRLYNVALTTAQVQQIYNFGACKLIANPSAIAFPNTTLGYSYSFPASVVSHCRRTLNLTAINAPGSPFSMSGILAPMSLAPGQKANYTAIFSPTKVGTATGSIVFTSDADNPKLSVSLTGTGVTNKKGALSCTPTSLSFGNVTVNSTVSQAVTITNIGGASVTVSAITVTGTGFSVVPVATPFTLTPGQSKQLTVKFSPTTIGAATGTLTITDTGQVATLSVPLSGTGVTQFTISAAPASLSVLPGNSGSSTITTAIISGFNSSIALSAAGVPSGTTVSFNPNPIAAPGAGSSRMTIMVGSSTPVGTYPITVTGNGGGIQRTATVTLTVTPDPTFTISAVPASLSVVRGNQGSSSITTTIIGGFNSSIALSAAGVPSGTTVSFNPNPIAAPGASSSSMTITVGSSTPVGTYPITVTGNGGGIQQSTSVNLTVKAQVNLSWTASTSPAVVGYNAYRSTTSGGPYTKLNSSLIISAAYTDQTVQRRTTYYYVVTSVDSGGNESPYSNQATATVP